MLAGRASDGLYVRMVTCRCGRKGSRTLPLYEDPWFTFQFEDDRIQAAARCLNRLLIGAVGAVPRGGSLYRFRASLAALGAAKTFTLHGGFRASLLPGPEIVSVP
jgi:hypothetical protein